MLKLARIRLSAAMFRAAERCYKVADRLDPPQTVTIPLTGSLEPRDYSWRRDVLNDGKGVEL